MNYIDSVGGDDNGIKLMAARIVLRMTIIVVITMTGIIIFTPLPPTKKTAKSILSF